MSVLFTTKSRKASLMISRLFTGSTTGCTYAMLGVISYGSIIFSNVIRLASMVMPILRAGLPQPQRSSYISSFASAIHGLYFTATLYAIVFAFPDLNPGTTAYGASAAYAAFSRLLIKAVSRRYTL